MQPYKENQMKVIYNDPDGRKGTYHPKLGYLASGVPFDLEDEIAKVYVKSGLLEKQTNAARKKRETSFRKKEVKDGHIDKRA